MITMFTGELAVALGYVIVITNVRSYNKFAFDSFPFDSHVDYAPYLCRATYVIGEITRVFTSYENLYFYVRFLQITRFWGYRKDVLSRTTYLCGLVGIVS